MRTKVKSKVLLGDAFIVIAVCASAFPNYNYFNFFKILLLIISIISIVLILPSSKNNLFIFLYFLYSLFLFANIKQIDSFSIRIVFNSIVILVSSKAINHLGISRRHLKIAIILTLLFFVYNYFFNINPIDGKAQVHAQIFTLIFLLFMYPKRLNLKTFFLIIVSNVRSALVGFIPMIFYIRSDLKSKGKKPRSLILYFILLLSLFSIAILFSEYIISNLGRIAHSFSWRIIHWNNILHDFSINDWLWGKGLGFSWRVTLDFNNFYTDGSSYFATHSNYIKIIAETGLVGFIIFFGLIRYLYKKSHKSIQQIILFYIGYGFYDEGIWLFSIVWLFLLTNLKVDD